MTTKIYKFIPLTLLALFVFAPSLVLAHQPRITESRQTQVPSPEISKAYYGKLTGEPDVYVIQASEPFDLYVNILVPDIAGQKKDVSAVVIKDGNVEKPLAVLDGIHFEWKKFYEPFGADSYWMGPEYKARAVAGMYEIRVSSPNNDSKYSLAIGEIEAFDGKEGLNALTVIPELKKNFFEVSPISFIKSPFGWGLIVVMYILAFIVGFIYRTILKKFAKNSSRGVARNIGKPDRLLRAVIGVALLLWAITTTWSPILIFFSGFAFFESIFSWCGFYAALGKNTCPVE
ncbi:MAG: DUF2892 domain-containing protein [Candidatus Adlerbacteria bacterium]|nr:DUF2892 domain-containing protein [Candidatus Adlerbacteria bacterium]